jgi:hypothetical protein
LSVQALPGAGFDPPPKIRAVRAKADAFVSESEQTKNFGRTRALLVKGSPTIRTYVRFSVDLSSDQVRHVSLLLYSRTRSRIGYQVRLVNGSWRERKINYANAPRLSARYMASGALRAGAWKAVDVTSLVAGEENGVSFALTTPSAKGAELASRETGLHGPRLVVETQRSDTTGSTTTSTQASDFG